jgi:hypothetical protein
VTEDKRLPKEERKMLQETTAPSKSHRAKMIKLADKTSNLVAIATSPPPSWGGERRLEYIAWAQRVAAGLRGTNEFLEERFDTAADVAKHSVTNAPRTATANM